MSLKGIDGQMMVHRSTEYVKDASAQLRRSENAQDYLAHQNKVIANLDKDRVASLASKDEAAIHTEERNAKQGGNLPKKKKKVPVQTKNNKVDAFEPDNPTVGVAPYVRLDIEI